MILQDYKGTSIELHGGDSLVLEVVTKKGVEDMKVHLHDLVPKDTYINSQLFILYQEASSTVINTKMDKDRIILKQGDRFISIPVDVKEASYVLPDFLLIKHDLHLKTYTGELLKARTVDGMLLKDMDISVLSQLSMCPCSIDTSLKASPGLECTHACLSCWARFIAQNQHIFVDNIEILNNYRKALKERDRRRSI